VETLANHSDAELVEIALSIVNEQARRLSLVGALAAPKAPTPLIGWQDACALLGMTQRRLYALERAGKLPFAKSRSQKDRAYDRDALVNWRDRQVSKAA
jgi:hypothetical protein